MNDDKFILVIGNLSDGFTFYGPFNSFDEADVYSNGFGYTDSWITTLNTPEEE